MLVNFLLIQMNSSPLERLQLRSEEVLLVIAMKARMVQRM